MQQFIAKAAGLVEALPYIRRFSGKTFVIKYGGSAMPGSFAMQNMMRDIALLTFCGIRVILVHGGGPEISSLCKELNIAVRFEQGQRVTDEKTLAAVQMVLLGKVNSALVAELCLQGVKAIGLSGQDAAFIRAHKLSDQAFDLGWVGDVTAVDNQLILTLLANGFMPVIAPLARDQSGQAYNINADTVAAAVAGATKAEKLVLLSDVNGIYADINDANTRISSMNLATIEDWLQTQRIQGGMIPKVKAGVRALEAGVTQVHILDGTVPHSLLLEIFTDDGIGTMLTQ